MWYKILEKKGKKTIEETQGSDMMAASEQRPKAQATPSKTNTPSESPPDPKNVVSSVRLTLKSLS